MQFRNIEIWNKRYERDVPIKWEPFRNNYLARSYFGTGIVWKDYVDKLDFGIRLVEWSSDEYEVIDEKKWLINKIKYGF